MSLSKLKHSIRLRWGYVILFVAATAAVWFGLKRMDRGVAWLKVEAPRQAVVGEVLPMRIQVAGLEEASHLCVDLHWATVRDASKGYLATGGAKPVGRDGGVFEFEILVPARNNLRFVNGIFFLSPTGEWSNHTFVAATELIPVKSELESDEPGMVQLLVREMPEARAHENAHLTTIPRLLTGFVLLLASALAWMTLRSVSRSSETTSRERRWSPVLAAALTLASIWELLGLENWFGARARALARAEDLYYPRAWIQKVVISVTITTALVFLCFVWRKRSPCQLALVFFSLYLALSIVNLFSFHFLDDYAGLSWHGITLIEALKLVCVAGTLKGVFRSRR